MRTLRLIGLALILAIWVGTLAISAGREIRVPQDYQTIQEAIDAAAEGDTILVDIGTYKENLRIPKGLTLIGADREQTIIEGGGNDVIAISSVSLVTVRNFTITGGRDGVFIAPGAQALLRGNRILQNQRDGVLVIGSAELLGNFIADNGRCGVQTLGPDATVTGSGNIIQNNAGGNLCGNVPEEIVAVGGPPAPTLTVTPEGWTNRNEFTLDWELPDYAAAIVAAWYKIGSAPTGPEDGTRTTEKPLSLQSPAEGRIPVWVWLEDELGQKDHRNAAQGFLLLDQTEPVITATIAPEPNAQGWNNTDVTVRFDCRDTLSDIASCTEPIVITEEVKGHIIKGEAVDKAGNRAETSVTINLDKTEPQIQVGDPQGTLGNEGWYLTDVAVTFTAEDNLSGFPNGQLKLEETKRTSGEGEDLRLRFVVEDLAGNSAEAEAGPFKVDKTLPQAQILLDPSRPDGQNGWYVSPVTVRYICTDAVSGVSPETPCPLQETISEDGTHELRLTVEDRAGHTNSDSKVIKLDQTPPEVICQVPDAEVWHAEDVTIKCTASDATSGLADPEDASFTLIASGEGKAVSTGSRRIIDQAGNSRVVGPFTFKIDKTLPTIKAVVSPEPNEFGWNNKVVNVHFICKDNLSGIASCTPDQKIETEGKEQKVVGEAVDHAGHRATTEVEVNIDMTAPEVTFGQPQGTLGNEGWYLSDVQIPFTAKDNLAGFAPDGRLTLEGTKSTVGEGADLIIKITMEDLAGNSAEAQAGPFKVDKTPPEVQILLEPPEPDGLNGWYIHPVIVKYECHDAISGLDPQTPCPPTTALTDDGIHSLNTGVIKDIAGNSNSAFKVVKLDRTPPKVECQRPDPNVWYPEDVIVVCTASDATSGLADPEDASFILQASGEGEAVPTGSHRILDRAGNVATIGPFNFKIDKTSPTIEATVSPEPNEFGWNNTDVTVIFNCQDELSGIASCTEPISLTAEGKDQLAQGEAIDKAGNRAVVQVKVNIDKTKPVIEVGEPQGILGQEGWYLSDVMVPFTAEDNLSGFAPDGRLRLGGSQRSSGEGTNIKIDISVSDLAGNEAEATVGPFKVDKTPPKVSCHPPDQSRWYREDVTVPCTANDVTSGLANPSDASFTLVARGEGEAISTGTHTVADKAGNIATAGPYTFKIDKTPPQIRCTPPDATRWYREDVSVRCTASDSLSGLASARDTNFTLIAHGEGRAVSTGTRTVLDRAGNGASVGPFTFKIDKTPPNGSLKINDGASTTYSLIVTLQVQAHDSLSGVSEMRFSNDGRTWSGWEPFKETRNNWDLSRFGGNPNKGSKTVWGQVKDRAGNISRSFKASINFIPTIRVPEDFRSIQGAIDAARDDYVILVSSGTYKENLRITKDITLKGESPDRVTIHGVADQEPVIYIMDAEVKIENLTITGGKGYEDPWRGNGILLEYQATVTIRNCHIKDNESNGICVIDAEAIIENNTISGNGQAGIFVGGVYARATIRSNLISRNGWGPGSIYRWLNGIAAVGWGVQIIVEGNTIQESKYTGIIMGHDVRAEIWRNIIQENRAGGVMLNIEECNPFGYTGFEGSVSGGGNTIQRNSWYQVCPEELAFLTTPQGGHYP